MSDLSEQEISMLERNFAREPLPFREYVLALIEEVRRGRA